MGMADMGMAFFAESLAEICARSLVAPGRSLRWLLISNPTAGGFVMASRWKKCRSVLELCRKAARMNPQRDDCAPAETAAKRSVNTALAASGLVNTDGPGAAAKIAGALTEEAAAYDTPFYLIITAGGDGTSREVLSVLYHVPEALRSRMAVLRLPMGTGNDGADAPELAAALDLLLKPTRIVFTPALRLLTAPNGPAAIAAESQSPFLAFNILSVGLDAFVTHMTNKMKGKFPGDFYKLWVDIAALFYDRLYTVGFLDVKALDTQGGELLSLHEKILLLAVGASGHRTYGSQKKILPDSRNVCMLRQMSLSRKLALKGLLNTGGHSDKDEAIMLNAHRVVFSGRHPMLVQMDGETVLLKQEDFPAAIELTAPVIPVLKLVT